MLFLTSESSLWRTRAPRLSHLALQLGLGLAMCLASLALPSIAAAQEAEAEPVRIVVMTIPGGGTKLLAETVATLPNTTPFPESWFNTQVKQRGFSARTVFKSPKDLGWVMGGAKIDLIVDFSRKRRSNTLKVYLYPASDAKIARTLEIEVDPTSGLNQEGADQITASIEDLLASRYAATPSKTQPDPQQEPEKDPDPKPQEDDLRKQLAPTPTPGFKRQPWLWVSGSGSLLKRDLSVSSRNGVVLNYESAFYPGYALNVEATPAKGVPFGFYATFVHGFDNVNYKDADDKDQVKALTQLQFEGALGYYLVRGALSAKLRGGLRWASFGIDPNEVLPSTSFTSIMLQGQVGYTISRFTVQGQLELIPISFWGENTEQFGQNPGAYGLGGVLGVQIQATPEISVPISYSFGLLNSSFEGEGAARFQEASAFDLTQSIRIGVQYQL